MTSDRDTVALIDDNTSVLRIINGGVEASPRIEVFGDLHQYGGLNGKVPDRAEAVAALARKKGA